MQEKETRARGMEHTEAYELFDFEASEIVQQVEICSLQIGEWE